MLGCLTGKVPTAVDPIRSRFANLGKLSVQLFANGRELNYRLAVNRDRLTPQRLKTGHPSASRAAEVSLIAQTRRAHISARSGCWERSTCGRRIVAGIVPFSFSGNFKMAKFLVKSVRGVRFENSCPISGSRFHAT